MEISGGAKCAKTQMECLNEMDAYANIGLIVITMLLKLYVSS